MLVRKSSKLDSDLLGCKSWQRLEELIDLENSTFNIFSKLFKIDFSQYHART